MLQNILGIQGIESKGFSIKVVLSRCNKHQWNKFTRTVCQNNFDSGYLIWLCGNSLI